jgi:hypothetical protein
LSRRVYLDFGTTNYPLGGLEMHDYLKGAYEALSWVRLTLKGKKDVEKVLEEVNGAINDITEGVAVDFRERLKTIGHA